MTVSPISFPNYQVNSTVDPSTWASLSHLGEILKEQQQQAEAEKLIAGLFGQSQQQDMSAMPPLRSLAQPPAAPPSAPQAAPQGSPGFARSLLLPEMTPNQRVARGFQAAQGGPAADPVTMPPAAQVAQATPAAPARPDLLSTAPNQPISMLYPQTPTGLGGGTADPATPDQAASYMSPRPTIPPRAVAQGGDEPQPMDRYAAATASIESGSPQGNYKLVGPKTGGGDRALGKYQVMGNNVRPWTREVLGRELTPTEFLNSPEAQEAVYRAKFGEYVQKYGPTGAAKAWFAGERGMKNPNARDVLGTSVSSYAEKFNRNAGLPNEITGGQSQEQPSQPSQALSFDQVHERAAQNLVSDQPTRAAGITSEQLSALYRNPVTRPIAMGFLQKQLDPGTYEFMAAGDSIIRYNKRDGTYTTIDGHQKQIPVPEKSRIYDPNTKTFIGGDDGGSSAAGDLPPNMRWKDPKNKMAGVEPIPGGTGEKIDSDIAARVGLARSFIGQLPQLRERIERGDVGIENPINHAKAIAGVDVPGETRRMADAGAEALIRMLTGAGMGIQEAKENAEQYRVSPRDTKFAVKSKIDALERHLEYIADTLGKGRGGSLLPAPSSSAAGGDFEAHYNSLPSGSTFVGPDGKQRRKP